MWWLTTTALQLQQGMSKAGDLVHHLPTNYLKLNFTKDANGVEQAVEADRVQLHTPQSMFQVPTSLPTQCGCSP